MEFKKIEADPSASAAFLTTRAYVRAAATAAAAAIKLARPKAFDARYLLAGEDNALASAVAFGRDATAAGWHPDFPPASAAGLDEVMPPGELGPQETAIYEKVKANPAAVAAFLETRAYVRSSAAVVAAPENKKLARELRRPKAFNEKYVLAGEEDTLNAATDLSLNAIAESMWDSKK